MSAIVTDQFRILNASNFVDSIESNSYYITLGLANPVAAGYGRTSDWNTNPPSPTDNLSYAGHTGDTILFGKKITSANVRRIVRRIDWTAGTKYEIYRDDYSVQNRAPITNAARLYDANYYVMNEDYRVYICIENGSSGSNPKGNVSQDQPTFTDLEPSRAGDSGDGYIWKYLFTISPSDIIKFDSTDYITVPNNWDTSSDAQIRAMRESGDSTVNENQIKTVYIDDAGGNYANGLGQEMNIIGDGEGGKVRVDVEGGKITNTVVVSGGKDYSYALVDLGSINSNSTGTPAHLIPIIPPSRGHGHDIYRELGTDRVLVYARFDDSTKDYPVDTNFAQVGILKNPEQQNSTDLFTLNEFSSLESIKLSNSTLVSTTNYVGAAITQTVNGQIARGYVASYDSDTQVLKYFQDRSLNFGDGTTNVDNANVGSEGSRLKFGGTGQINGQTPSFSVNIDTGFSGVTTTVNGKIINLGSSFTAGVSTSQINKKTGDIIYIDNRTPVSRDLRQKEDVKIILEF